MRPKGANKSLRGRGGVCPARDITAIAIYRENRIEGFPLWGKLSPQVTDEGQPAGHLPLIRRVPRHLPPKGKAFSSGANFYPLVPSVLLSVLQPCRSVGFRLASQASRLSSYCCQAASLRIAVPVR